MYYQDDRDLAFRLVRLFEGAEVRGEPGQWPTTIVLGDGTALHVSVRKGRGHVGLALGDLLPYLHTYGPDADIVPAASFGLARTDVAIAKQVARSVIEPGRLLIAVLRCRKQKEDGYEARLNRLRAEIAEALHEPEGQTGAVCAEWPDGENWRITAEIRTDDSIHFDIDANRDQALRLIEAMGFKKPMGAT